jgi:lysophospholipid acyltransferase (LPLAT)-like uncharacterized protein
VVLTVLIDFIFPRLQKMSADNLARFPVARRKGLLMPQKGKKREKGDRLWFRTLLFVLPKIVGAYFKLVDLTSRKVFLNGDIEETVLRKRRFCLASFHGAALWPAYYFRSYGGIIMVSRSWDGELIDRCLRQWRYDTARGSSSKFGKEALQEMIDTVNERGCNSGMAVDAPRGPAREVKIGAVIIAKETGQPLVPAGTWTTRHLQFNSWDKMILPLPFGTVITALGEPIEVPEGLDRDEYERIRQEVERRILETQLQAEAKAKELLGEGSEVVLRPVPSETSSRNS